MFDQDRIAIERNLEWHQNCGKRNIYLRTKPFIFLLVTGNGSQIITFDMDDLDNIAMERKPHGRRKIALDIKPLLLLLVT